MAKRTEKNIIAIIGKTNAGKSSLLNLLSGQKDFAIVDKKAGTTADTVVTHMEIHDLGPFKILDTAGVDEFSELGEKKRKKTFEALEEADLSLIVIDLFRAEKEGVQAEKELLQRVRRNEKQFLVVYNVISNDDSGLKSPSDSPFAKGENALRLKEKFDDILNAPSIAINANDENEQRALVEFIKEYFSAESRHIDLIPGLKNKGYVVLVIPMDEETPTLRLLRPQDMAVERLLRNFMIPVLFRMDLGKARNEDPAVEAEEKKRYLHLLEHLNNSSEGLPLIITDSQAFDKVVPWTPLEYPLTSFSVMMTNYMSFGNLEVMTEGVKAIDTLKPGSKVLITEACNHDRKCDDIATAQLPRILEKKAGGKLNIDFAFGRIFPEEIEDYDIIIHCGSCMIDRQKYLRRIRKAKEARVPFTNYGFVLSYVQNKDVLERVTRVFMVTP